MKRLLFACLVLAYAAPHARAWDSPAPDIVLYATPSMQAPLRDLAARYTAEFHVHVQILIGSPGGQAGLIRHRARADILVAEAAIITALNAEHLICAGSITPLGTDAFILIGKAGAARTGNVTPAQLIATHATVLPDATPAASFDGAGALRNANAGTPARVIGVADTPTVADLVRDDATLIGLVNSTEAAQPGIDQLASLAAPPVAIAAALLSNGQSRNAASFLAYIAGPRGSAILRQAGLERAS